MKIGILIKYTIICYVIIFLVAALLGVYTYFDMGNNKFDIVNHIASPIVLLMISFLYSRKIKKNGWLRGAEIWLSYFILLNILYFLLKGTDSIMYFQMVYIPVCLLGGILGVNSK